MGLNVLLSYLEPVCCSMSSSNCCFLTCIQTSQEAGQVRRQKDRTRMDAIYLLHFNILFFFFLSLLYYYATGVPLILKNSWTIKKCKYLNCN